MSKKSIEPPQDSLGRMVSITSSRAQQILARMLEPHDLTPQQWIVLGVLWRQDGVSVGEIATYMRSEKPAVSRLVDRMEKAGWVQKSASSSDARSILVSATPKANEKRQLLRLYEDLNEVLLQGFSSEEVEQLFSMLGRVRDNATKNLSLK